MVQVNKENKMLTKIVGKMTVEKEWLEKKLKNLGLSDKKEMIELELKTVSVSKQCQLVVLSSSSLYYDPKFNPKKALFKARIHQIFEDIPIYGEAKVHQQLLEDGYQVRLNTVSSYHQQLGLKAVLGVK